MRSYAKEIHEEFISKNLNLNKSGLWNYIRNTMIDKYHAMESISKSGLNSWIKNVCLNDQLSPGKKIQSQFKYTDEMREFAKKIYKQHVPEETSKRQYGIWALISKSLCSEYSELSSIRGISLQSWIRNICLYNKVGPSERSKNNENFLKATQAENERRRQEFISTYPAKLKEKFNDKIILVKPKELKGAHIPIDHYCREHKETRKIRPAAILGGRSVGLKCCINNFFTEELDNERAKLCGIKWIEDHQNQKKSRKCECLKCGFKFSIIPSSIADKVRRDGHINDASSCPRCMRLVIYHDNIKSLSENIEYGKQDCELYIFWDESGEWFKIGISSEIDQRESRAKTDGSKFYGQKIISFSGKRAECWATEQLSLSLTLSSAPSEEEQNQWVNKEGITEIRRAKDWDYDAEKLSIWLEELFEDCKKVGWITFLKKFHPFLDDYIINELEKAQKIIDAN